MTMRIGLYVGGDRLAAVAVARRGIVWYAALERDEDSPLEIQVAELLRGIPTRRFIRPSVFIALGPAIAHVKLLRGLPPVAAPRVVRQLIEGTPSRFFLVGLTSPVVANPERCKDGWWVAVADASMVAALDGVCARRGLRQGGMRPVAALLDRALDSTLAGTRVHWLDGDVNVEIIRGDSGMASVQRTSAPWALSPALTSNLDGPLEKLGADAWRFAGAYAAARAGASAPLMLRQQDMSGRRPRGIALRVASIGALVIGTAVTLAAPGILSAHARHQNDRAFDEMRAVASAVAKDRFALEQQQAALRQVRAFVESRRLLTPLLSALSVQLPESTAIVALRLDTLGGTLNALSPAGAELVQAVSGTPGVDGLQLNAPITRETVGSIELQRTALRFRFKRRTSTTQRQRR
jgi:hypothetical protein